MVSMSLADCLKKSESLTSGSDNVVGKELRVSKSLTILVLGK